MARRLESLRRKKVSKVSGIVLFLGLWLTFSPAILNFGGLPNAASNALICGILVSLLAFIKIFDVYRSVGLSYTNMALGAWIFLSPWILDYAAYRAPFWNSLIVGAGVLIFSNISSKVSKEIREEPARERKKAA